MEVRRGTGARGSKGGRDELRRLVWSRLRQLGWSYMEFLGKAAERGYGLSPATFYNVLSGRAKRHYNRTKMAFYEILGVDIDEFLGSNGDGSNGVEGHRRREGVGDRCQNQNRRREF